MKKIIIMFLMASGILFSASITVSAKVTTNTQKLTLYIGDEKQLKAWKNNVKWAIPVQNYVSISKTGKVKALNKGKATVTAIHGNKKKKFIITVKISVLDIDFSNVAKIEVRNLNYGFLAQIKEEDFINITKLFEENVFYRYTPIKKTKTRRKPL